MYRDCTLCPRKCHADRTRSTGFCRSGSIPRVNLYKLHFGEEPVISGESGSGTVFFEGCSLGCVFCQNYQISRGRAKGGEEADAQRLSAIFLELQSMGASNINLVTFMHFAPTVKEALIDAKNSGLKIPVAANISGYEEVSTLKLLDGLIDIYMPDFKFWDGKLSASLAAAPDYREKAVAAIAEMFRQTGPAAVENGLMVKGTLVRHLMLPGKLFDSKKIIDHLTDTYGNDIYISLMSQYTPMPGAEGFLARTLDPRHYESMVDYLAGKDQINAFVQSMGSIGKETIPDFRE